MIRRHFKAHIGASLLKPSYSTTFPADENPLSEGGKWVTGVDPNLSVVRSLSGNALGTQTDGDTFAPYNDSLAYLPTIGPSFDVTAVVFKAGGINDSFNHEIEFWSNARSGGSVIDATPFGFTTTTGYELNVHHLGDYVQLGRFKRANLVDQALGVTPTDGDTVRFRCIYTSGFSARHTLWWNGAQIFDHTDNAPEPPGFFGIGMYRHAGGDNSKFGWKSISVLTL